LLPLLLPGPVLCLDRVEITEPTITLALHTTAATVPCPVCTVPTARVHSRYVRQAADLPIQGRPTWLRLTVRRFFCANRDCPRVVFCEPLPGLLSRHAQATARLNDARRHVGLALGGQPGARLATKLGMPTSGDTLLRRVKQSAANAEPEPLRRAVGVDDWAIRKGHTYGTILIDLERGEVVELLPGRDGVALKVWLGQHPEVELLSRDRASAFAEAATEAAPQAKQVADRFHLLKNVREALQRFLERQAGRIRAAFSTAEPGPPPAGGEETLTPARQTEAGPAAARPGGPAPPAPRPPQPPSAKRQTRLDRYHEVRRRHAQGQPLQRIAREMHLAWRTVRRYVQADQCPNWRPGRAESVPVADHAERIDAWLATGQRNVSRLRRDLQAEGIVVGYDALRVWVARRLAARGEQRRRLNAAEPGPRPPPSAKGLSFAVLRRPEERTDEQQTEVTRLRELNAEVAQVVGLVEELAAMLRQQSRTNLADWHEKVRQAGNVELRRLADGLQRDQAAVQAALDLPWSNGPVEGQINRLKMLKRQMYGRAGLPLLRARIVAAG
jgi:transposase